MQAIWKFPLRPADKTVIDMPRGAKILCVQAQRETPCIWVIIPDIENKITQPRTFVIYGTGHEHEFICGNYVGTFQLHDGTLVFHVFEI